MHHNFVFLFIFLFFILLLLLLLLFKKNTGNQREGFTWSKQAIGDFLTFQQTVNPTTQFDMDQVQRQATEGELKTLLETGYWPWSNETKYSYMDAVAHNKIVKINPDVSLDYVRKIYNENAAKQLLSWNTKEGEFLLRGVKIKDGTIRCVADSHGKEVMKKTVSHGYNLWNGYKNLTNTFLKDDELNKEIPGFQFIKKNCNPCVAINNDYSCPFTLRNNKVSDVWNDLWGL
jgi:hypothetical protein